MSRRTELAVLSSAVMMIAIIIIATQPRDVFWGSDSGNRFIQVQSVLRTSSIAIEHRWPIGHHFLQIAGRTYSYWSPVFPLVAAPFYAFLGSAGLFVLPVAGTLLLIFLLPMLTKRSISATGIILVFGTPILWYTVVFWEHTLAAAIVVAALILAERERPFVAGLLAGTSTLLREEGYIVIAAIVAAIVISRRAPRNAMLFVAGALVPLIPFWIVNFTLFGNPFGLHAVVYHSLAHGSKLSNFFPFLFEFSSMRPANVLLVIPAIALIVSSPFRMSASVRALLFVITSIGFVGLTILLFRSPAPLRETLYLQGFFPAVPFSAMMFLSIRKLWNEQRFQIVTVLGGIALTTLSLNQSDFGVIWGPRHFLWLLPLVIVLAMESLSDFATNRMVVASAIALLVCSFAIQFRGIGLLRGKLRFSEDVLQAVRHDPASVVLTDVFWIPEDLAAAFYEKQFGVVRNDQELSAAMNAIGRHPFLFIAARQFRLVSNRGFAQILPRVRRRQRIAGIDPMLDVMLLDVQ